MTKVVQLSIVKQERQLSVEEAWGRFAAATEKAKATMSIEDGIAAGKAYADFVRLFDRKAS
jgi:hypothetical protein